MTIKQQGGIFGRNPTFNTLNVQNGLTVGGTVTHSGTQNITGQLNVDNLRLDGNTISVLDSNGNLVLAPNGTGDVYTIGDAVVTKGNFQDVALTIANGSATVGNKREILFTDQGGTTAFIRAYGSAFGSGLNNVLQFGSTTNTFNLTPAGNIAFPSGQGIDFSATDGTGTSELFDDYEEGTWTPTVTSGAGTVTLVDATNNFYTKIGRTVQVFSLIGISTNASVGTSDLTIGGLPYAVTVRGTGNLVNTNYSAGDWGTGGAHGLVFATSSSISHVARTVDISSRATFYWSYYAIYTAS
jgi:hypothetical protein